MCTAGAPRPPRAAGTWAAAGGAGHAGPSRSVAESERPARRGPWPCATRAPRAPACWRSCCARAGGHWPRSPPSRATGVRAAACASAPRCAACICCWRPCPPWRRRPPSCESGGAPGTWARGAAGSRGPGGGSRGGAFVLRGREGGGPELSARRLRSRLCSELGIPEGRESCRQPPGKALLPARPGPAGSPPPLAFLPLPPLSGPLFSWGPASPSSGFLSPPSFPLPLFPPPSTRRFPLPVFPSSPSAAPLSRLWGGEGPSVAHPP